MTRPLSLDDDDDPRQFRRTQPKPKATSRSVRPLAVGVILAGLVLASLFGLALGRPWKPRTKADPEAQSPPATPTAQSVPDPKPASPPPAVVNAFAHAEVVMDGIQSVKQTVRALDRVRDYPTAEEAIRMLHREAAVLQRCTGMMDDLGTPPDAAVLRLIGLLTEYKANVNAAFKAAGNLASGVAGEKEPPSKEYDERAKKALVEFGTATDGIFKCKAFQALLQRTEELRDEWDRAHGRKEK